MATRKPLTLYEEILLIALDDDKGTTGLESMHKNAMAGAILAELVLAGAVAIDDDKKKLVTPTPGAGVADPILAECLELVQTAKKRRKAAQWVMKFASLKDLTKRTARQLVAKGVLKEDRDRVLGLFRRTIFPERDGGPERELTERLRHAIFTSSTHVDERTVVLAVLADATSLLPKLFEKRKLKERRQRLKNLAEGRVAAAATREAIEAMRAAAAVAMIGASVAVSAAASH
jgi:hypothetical protein